MDLLPLGDRAILIRVGDAISDAVHVQVRAITNALADLDDVEIVPAFASVAVYYDPTDASFAQMRDALRDRLSPLPAAPAASGSVVEIPVRYGGLDGPDLDDVARHAGLTTDDVIRLHTGAQYEVYMIGFAPGFPYLAGLPAELAVPRLDTPRLVVPAGSVAIAGHQACVYPVETPGGWRIIGRTSLQLFSPHAATPTLLQMGDRVRFVPR